MRKKILVEMMMNRCDMEVVEAYNGLYFPLENKNKKKRAWENK